ncbi:hypothetical protein CJ014_23720 [Pleomorphomonas carboxyditropha]|uniref:Glycoside hydrolase family 5 domain-containing protein n=2 Tax=Pleomorphomonas carboxyditropha TaxID=2023338 RepID=A0A2G9WR16_9HYPH|nr:hypothetical protein CJ014_23720 [Pleomorphomonas carboxyditropha]
MIAAGPSEAPEEIVMPRLHRVLSLALACLTVVAGASAATAAPLLKRGVNFEIWQTWTGRDAFLAPEFDRNNFPDWMGRVDDRQLARLKAEGFDFVRLGIDAAALLWAGDDGAGPLIDRIVAATERLQALGFTVIVDLHLLPADEERPDGLEDVLGTDDHAPLLWDRYLGLVARVAARLAALPPDLTLLEPINEPNQDWSSHFRMTDRWPDQLAALAAAARAAAPTLTLVLTGGKSGGIDGLERLDPTPFAGDANIVWTFHYYEPMAVSHAGRPWLDDPGRYLTHLPYPAALVDDAAGKRLVREARARIAKGVADPKRRKELDAAVGEALDDYRATDAGPATIAADFQRVSDWAAGNGIPAGRVLLGEFGIYQNGADPAARIALIAATRAAAERQGFAWAVYDAGLTAAGEGFSVVGDNRTLALEPQVKAALGLAK